LTVAFDDSQRLDNQPSARLRLAAELAVGLARRLWMTLHGDATDAGFCWHMFQSTFVGGCYVLWELGVAVAGIDRSDDQGMTRQQSVAYAKQYPGDKRFDLDQQSLFKFLPAPETRAGVLAYGELPDALFGRLLEAYVDNACHYGPDEETLLYLGPEPFKPMVEFDREIAALVACGYAERRGAMVKWTDKIAPVMWAEVGLVDPTPPIRLPPDVLERVNELLQDDNYIAAIAVVREEAGAGLLEARTYVDSLRRKSH
jgi:hypothetical protein